MSISKGWNWSLSTEKAWLKPSEESFYLLHRWQEQGFQNLLDLGSGRGRHALQFARAGFQVDALDLAPKVMEVLQEQADAENLPIRAKTGDMGSLP